MSIQNLRGMPIWILKTEFIGFIFHRIQHCDDFLIFPIEVIKCSLFYVFAGEAELQPALSLWCLLHWIGYFVFENGNIASFSPSFSKVGANRSWCAPYLIHQWISFMRRKSFGQVKIVITASKDRRYTSRSRKCLISLFLSNKSPFIL